MGDHSVDRHSDGHDHHHPSVDDALLAQVIKKSESIRSILVNCADLKPLQTLNTKEISQVTPSPINTSGKLNDPEYKRNAQLRFQNETNRKAQRDAILLISSATDTINTTDQQSTINYIAHSISAFTDKIKRGCTS